MRNNNQPVSQNNRSTASVFYAIYGILVLEFVSLFEYHLFLLRRNYGLPLHLIRELYETFRNFKIRVTDYLRYRKITSNMNERFPDATPEELSA